MPADAFRFAHFTDIHLPIREKPEPQMLMNKRVLGYLSWRRRRSERHKQWASEALAADARGQSCKTVLISGDLVNIALPSEFRDARNWLDEQFADSQVVYVPGNHDTYTNASWDETLGLLAPYMSGKRSNGETDRQPDDFSDFPFCLKADAAPALTVIGANSSPTTAPGLASGSLGDDQRQRVKQMINGLSNEKTFKVLMLHHPISPGVVSRRKELTDRVELCNELAGTDIDLVLHGHAHIQHINSVPTINGNAPVIGGASASHPMGHGKYRPARYNIFDVKRDSDGAWSINMTVRELDPQTQNVFTAETYKFQKAA